MGLHKASSWVACIMLALCALTSLSGCQTTSDDVRKWGQTQQGPRKLVAVLSHTKYPRALRIEAAMTLIGMHPRGGHRIGVDHALEALAVLNPAERNRLMAGLIPELIAKLGTPPPPKGQDDPSMPFKDAGFLILTDTEHRLLESEELATGLRAALTQWALADFFTRLDATGQKVAVEQMLRELGASSVTGLPELITPNTPGIARVAQLVAEIGDANTKRAASEKLVAVARFVSSPTWLEQQRPEVARANEVSGIRVDEKAFAEQLGRYREEELLRVFASIRRVGGATAVAYLLEFAADTTQSEQLRAGSLAALEGNLDANDVAALDALVKLVSEDSTPDAVRGLALNRLGELPREKVAERLLALFDHADWRVRWVAGERLLTMSTTADLPAFMQRLGQVKHMSLTEPLSYGRALSALKGEPRPETLVDSYSASSNKVPVRLTALGYYYSHGAQSDVPKLERWLKDPQRVPECAAGAKDCEWRCGESEVRTVGEYVEHCILPALRERNGSPKQEN